VATGFPNRSCSNNLACHESFRLSQRRAACRGRVNLIELAEAVGTPFYCYSTATLERHYRVFSEAFAGEKAFVCYAMKANSNQAVLRTLAKLGAGADVVSGGELKRALAAGMPPSEDRVLRRRQDRTRAARRARGRHPLHQRRVRAGARAAVATRVVEMAAPRGSRCASTPTSTPAPTPRSPPASRRTSSASRSRTAREVYARAAKLPGIAGHRHRHAYRQQITDLGPLRRCLPRCSAEFVAARCAPTATPSTHVDFGGGLGIPYRDDRAAPPDPAAYAAVVEARHANLGCTVCCSSPAA
jgi:diaminopimelate decarboxylase